jgi:peptide/nickel transport system permease protein
MTSISPPHTAPAARPKPLRQRLSALWNSYSVRIVLQSLLTVWAVTTFTFVLIRLMPGNPIQIRIDQLMNRGLTFEEAEAQAANLFDFDPDAPLFQQYLDFMGNIVQGDLGKSILGGGAPVNSIILEFLPWTLFSVGLGLLLSFLIGTLLGAIIAYRRGGILDNLITTISSILYGIPDYVIALLLILVAGVQLQWFQVGQMRGAYSPSLEPGFTFEFISSVLQHAVLPVGTYVLSTAGSWVLAMKSSTLSTLGEDYITVAKARGLNEARILAAYVGRNALLPLVTRLAISIGFVVGGSVIVEQFFQYPGLGSRLLRAITERDYTTMQGIFLVISVSVVASNALSDLLLGWLDPRVRVGKGQSKS